MKHYDFLLQRETEIKRWTDKQRDRNRAGRLGSGENGSEISNEVGEECAGKDWL